MSCRILKALRLFSYSFLLAGLTGLWATASAKVCFLPDAEECGIGDIQTQCDGVKSFINNNLCNNKVTEYYNKQSEDGNDKERDYLSCANSGKCYEIVCRYTESSCKASAEARTNSGNHYECYFDSSAGCWYLTRYECKTFSDPDYNSAYPYDSADPVKACKSNTWDTTFHKCTDKGLPYLEDGTKTTWDCKTKYSEDRGCSGYNLSSPLSGYDCDSCTPDRYETDYDGNWNRAGTGSTVYKCSKTAGCDGYNLSASEKATKEASGEYRCHDCTPNVTDSAGNTTTGATVYKCGKISTKTTDCPSDYISAAEKTELEKDTCYSCTGCTPHTDYYEDGVWYNGTSGITVYSCSKPSCEGKSKASDCATGKEFVAAGDCAKFSNGEACGDCIDCNDENNPINKCFGKFTCSEDGRHGVGAVTCTCGNVKYYDRCEVEETCNTDNSIDCSGSGECKNCIARTSSSYGSGYYQVGEKCKKVDLTPVYYYASCTGRDCNGNYGPAHGMKTCKNNEGAAGANSVDCGGYKYFSECAETCTTANSIDCSGSGECKNCIASTSSSYGSGYYQVGEKCEQNDGTKVYYYASCTGRDCNGNYGLAHGMKTCKNDEGVGTPVECGGNKYFSECKETCTTANSIDCSGSGECKNCIASTSSSYGSGYYQVGEKCEQNDGTKVYYYASCTGRDCNGNYGLAYGLKTCASNEYPGGNTVKCGGYTYAEYCMSECNYEDNAESCKDKGKEFKSMCHDENDKEWGECI